MQPLLCGNPSLTSVGRAENLWSKRIGNKLLFHPGLPTATAPVKHRVKNLVSPQKVNLISSGPLNAQPFFAFRLVKICLIR